MKKISVYLGRFLLFLLVVIVILVLTCFKPLDTTPYQQTKFYKKELEVIANYQVPQLPPDDTLLALEAGWAKVNLQPPFGTPIAIDAHRGGKYFEGVKDSIYVRAIVFKYGGKKVAYVSAELLIIPPSVSKLFDTLMHSDGFDNNNIYFAATHAHSSVGAWQNSYVGELFAGKYDERVPKYLATCMAKVIREAEKDCEHAEVGYAQFPTHQLVFNRLVHERGKIDSLLRIVKIKKRSGPTAAIITFAAHATVFHENLMQLSGDWPGMMMYGLEHSGVVNFACYSAGAVGSQGPYEATKNQNDEAEYMGRGVAKIIAAGIDTISVHAIGRKGDLFGMAHLPLYLRAPNLRVTERIVARPWLFNKLFGNEASYITVFHLGDIVFTGMPCDFSGELVSGLDSVAATSGKHLLITSFNGSYIGYITDDKWYGLKTYETRTMGWFGPGSGSYLSEVVARLLSK